MKTVAIENVLVNQVIIRELFEGGSFVDSEWKDYLDATSLVAEAYGEIYEKKLDPKFKKNFQQLSQEFCYSPHRVEEAQKRYLDFMEGKRFKMSPSDQKLLDSLVRKNNVASLQQSAKTLKMVSKVLTLPGMFFDIYDVANSFYGAQQSGDWRKFNATISALGSGMLIGTIVGMGITAGSLPVALVAAVIGVVASNYFDEEFWLRTQSNIRDYFAK